jgi:sulfur-oxidizing protein SoxZ
MASPRVKLPAQAKSGEVIEIKTLIAHDMETGLRKDKSGAVIPRKIINSFTAKFNGKEFLSADWHPAISANPFQAFYFRVTEAGTFDFIWKDDDGTEYKSSHQINLV